MKEFYKKHKKMTIGFSIIVFFVLVFVVPIIINCLYERPASIPLFSMSWEAKDVLSFYGSILGSFATIIAVVATIVFTINNQKEERKLSIKPYLQTKYSVINDTSDPIFNEQIIFALLHHGGFVETFGYMPDDLFEIEKNKTDVEEYRTKVEEYFSHNLYMIYEITNYGAGTAIGIRIEDRELTLVRDFCVSVGETKKYGFVFNDELIKKNNSFKIKFDIRYSDVCSFGEYIQSESFEFFRLENGELVIGQTDNDFLTSPTENNRNSKIKRKIIRG